MRRGGAALTALLAVLFTVLMLQVRQQGQRLQSLQDRLQILENNQDLERTNALEEQLRSTVQRLQNLEGMAATLQRLSSEQESLRQQLRSSSAAANKDRRDPEPLPLPEPAPAPQPGP
jgi:TolA-binding protein